MELYDLIRVLHRGCERVLGGIGSNWVHNPAAAMDLVGGQAEPLLSIASLWAWLRDPLIPAGENSLATQLRAHLGVPDSQTSASVDELDRLGQPLRRRLEALGSDLVRYHNPFVRHVIKRRRRDLRSADGTPVFREVPINLHGEGEDDALVMSDMMASAYDHARAYCQRIAKVRPGAGILMTVIGWEQAVDVLPSVVGQMAAARGAEERTAWRQPVDLIALCQRAGLQLPHLFAASDKARDWSDHVTLSESLWSAAVRR